LHIVPFAYFYIDQDRAAQFLYPCVFEKYSAAWTHIPAMITGIVAIRPVVRNQTKPALLLSKKVGN
jgi:hypothetical protein